MDTDHSITRLAELLSIITRGADVSADYLSAVQEIDVLLESGRKQLPGELSHFLRNRSYVKAANFIDKMDLKAL